MIRKQTFDNGLTLVTERMPHVRSVAIGVWLVRGSRHESPLEAGIAHFIEHMVFKGTAHRSQAQIAEELDSIGGHSDAFTTQEYAGFQAVVVDEHVPRAIDLLSDLVLSPAFDAEELERERKVILEEIKMVEDTPEDLVHEIFTESFWPNHPLGRPIVGSTDTVVSLKRSDLISFFQKTYVPSNLVIAAAGHLEHEAFAELVHKRFQDLKTPPDDMIETAPQEHPSVVAKEKDLEQVHLLLGTVAPPQAHHDRYAAYLLNAILGGNLSSRLFQAIREERGLAYSVYSSLSAFRDCGCFNIYAGTASENIGKVVGLVLDEIKRIKTEPVTAAELQRSQEQFKGSILLGLESSAARMSRLARQEIYFDQMIPVDQIVDALEAVTHEDILRLADQFFDQRSLALSIVGKLGDKRNIPETLVA